MAVDKTSLYVIDSSALLPYFLPDEKLPFSIKSIINKFINNKVSLIAPNILRYEIGNALKSSVKQKRLDKIDAGKVYSSFLDFPIQYISLNYHDTMEISLEYDLSYYDASYLYIAQKYHTQLLTLDKKLQNVQLSKT
jgi:predicted nucleic acid-binding protein